MPLDPDQYVRLKGSRWLTMRRRGDVYLGPDHILRVERSFPYEKYRRIGFDDVQAITCRRTPTGMGVSILLGGMTVLLARNWLAYADESILLAVIVIVAAAIWLIHVLQGGTCVCTVRSAVQTLELHSLATMRAARRALPRIQTAVEQVQGHLDSDEALQRGEEAYEAHRRVAASDPDGKKPRHDAGSYSPGGHAVLLSFTLATAVLGIITWLIPRSSAMNLLLLTTPVALVAGIIGALMNRGGGAPRSLATPVSLAIAYCASLFAIGMMVLINRSEFQPSPLMGEDVGFVSNLAGIMAIVGLTIALPGLLEIIRYRGHRETT